MRIKKAAMKALSKMPRKTADAFYAAFDKIEDGKASGLDIRKLSGREGFRLRIGTYRALYTHDLEVIVIDAGSRGDVYK
jgi:mRNA interferase RelE/StbE